MPVKIPQIAVDFPRYEKDAGIVYWAQDELDAIRYHEIYRAMFE